MSEIDHELCRYLLRDEQVRAAEDAAAVSAIQHRDLPEQVALLWASLGDIIGRVVRLEGEMDAGQDEEAAPAVCDSAHLDAHRGESVRVVEAATIGTGDVFADVQCGSTADEIARLTAERDAAIRERDAARARVAELERAYFAECEARAQAQRELSDLNDAIRARESGEERDSSYAALCREAAAARERADSMMPAKLAPAANAGGESNHESAGGAACGASESAEPPRTPSRSGSAVTDGRPAATAGAVAWAWAWAVWGRGTICGVTVSREDAEYMQREFAFDTELLPLYNAPQRPRCWLTAAERAQVQRARDELLSGTAGYDNEFANEKRRRAGVLTALLARSTPPMVKVPHLDDLEADERPVWESACHEWIAAIRAAGGEVEG